MYDLFTVGVRDIVYKINQNKFIILTQQQVKIILIILILRVGDCIVIARILIT